MATRCPDRMPLADSPALSRREQYVRRMLVVGLTAGTVGLVSTPAQALGPVTGGPLPAVSAPAASTGKVLARARANRMSAPASVVPGEAITVTGRQNYGRKRLVSLQRRVAGGWVKTRWKRTNAHFSIGASVPTNAAGSIKYRVRVSVTKKVRTKVRGRWRTVNRTTVHTVASRTVPVVFQRFTPTAPSLPTAGATTTFTTTFSVARSGRPVRLEEFRNGSWTKVAGTTQRSANLAVRATTQRYPAWYRITVDRWRGMKAKSSAPVRTRLTRVPDAISHRAGAGVRPENTLPALEQAIAEKPDAIEFDVQMSKDGVPFVLHDLRLSRTTDIASKWPAHTSKWATDFNYYEPEPEPEPEPDPESGEPTAVPPSPEPILSQLDAGYFQGRKISSSDPSLPYRIPTLDEWIARANGRVKLQLEVKHSVSNPRNDAVWAALEERLLPGGNLRELNDRGLLIVSAFEEEKVRAFKLKHPEVPVAVIQDPPPADMSALKWAQTGPEGYLNLSFRRASPAQYAKAKSLGFITSAWTARTLADHQRAIATGADRIVSDDLGLLDLALNPPRPR